MSGKHILIALFCGIFFQQQSAFGQHEIGLHFGPGLQTIEIKEAVITDGFKVAFIPEFGLQYRKAMSDYVYLSFGLAWAPKGARVSEPPLPGITDSVPARTWIIIQADYVNISAGMEGRYNMDDTWHLFANLDIALGVLTSGYFRNTFYDRGDPLYRTKVDNFFRSPYLGVDIGGGIGLKVGEAIAFRFWPQLELQMNRAYRSGVFIPKFIGLVPRIGMIMKL